jgi:hypothetical protein
MKDAKKKQPPVFQIEEVMINRMNVVNGRRWKWNSEATTTWRSGKHSRKESSKQAVRVNEPSWREDEEGLQSVAFGAWPQ